MKFVKIIILIIVIIFSLSILCSCGLFSRDKDLRTVHTMACYAVPGYYIDSKHEYYNKCLLDEDGYGRKLYSVSNAVLKDVLVVAQNVSKTHVYYYDNICYRFIDDYKNADTKDIEAIKAANDWGLPINKDKLVSRKLNDRKNVPEMQIGQELDFMMVYNFIEAAVGVPYDQEDPHDTYIDITINDRSSNGKELYVIVEYEFLHNPSRVWFMILTYDNGGLYGNLYDSEHYLVEMDIDEFYTNGNQILAEIKEVNGWVS